MGDRARPKYEGVLELRIHGVNNTSPASMLDLPKESVGRVVGDDLASFSREKDGAQAALQQGDRGWRAESLTREAYSWGGLARNSPEVPGTGTLATVGQGLARVGWALLLPFGIANIAYWTRRLDTGEDAKAGRSTGKGAGNVRLFGLGLTALAVVTACEAAMDLVATQCFQGEKSVCERLPSAFDVLANRELPARLVIAAAAPVLLLLVFYLLSSVTRSHYERSTSEAYERATTAGRTEGDIAKRRSKVVFAAPGFWSGDTMVGRLARLHLSVGLAIVTLSLAWPGVFGGGTACRAPESIGTDKCWDQVSGADANVRWWLVGCAGLALLVIIIAAATAFQRATDAPDVPDSGRSKKGRSDGVKGDKGRDFTPLLFGVAIAVVSLTALLMGRWQPAVSEGGALLGISVAPTITLALLATLALGGLTWRLGRLGLAWLPLLVVLFVPWEMSRWWLLALGAALLVLVGCIVIMSSFGRPGALARYERSHVAWGGAGPGVLMGLSMIVSMTLASLVTLVAGDWLNGKHGASDLIRGDVPAGADAGGDPHLLVAPPYVLFAAGTIVTLALLLLLAIAVLVRTALAGAPPATPPVAHGQSRRRHPRPEAAGLLAWLTRHAEPTLAKIRELIGRVTGAPTPTPQASPPAPPPPPRQDSPSLKRGRAKARRFAGRAHRAEKAVGVLVVLGLLSVTVVLVLATRGWPDHLLAGDGWEGEVRRFIDLSTLVLAGVGATVFAALVGGKAAGSTRPLGLLWDLVCLLPRAAHPFAPPCYAERAVPEIVGRCDWWLTNDHPQGEGSVRRGDRIVLSAHSLGSVLAVAALFALPSQSQTPGPMSLLTYGSQLRAYFGRIFPELLGPDVQGTPPARSAQLWAADPWQRELSGPTTNARRAADSVVIRLAGPAGTPPRWRSLWRRTDFLGFPVHSYRPNEIDRPAEETDETTYLTAVVAHSDYPRAPAYGKAFDELTPPAD